MRIFLTGGTGYIGGALARRLCAEGQEVVALVRPASPGAEPLRAVGAMTVVGDITDRFSLREGMAGADWVVHAAAELNPRAPKDRIHAANVQGSENIASLASKLGIGRLLSVSSMAYFGGSAPGGASSTEESPIRRPFPTLYGATKHAGERAIQEWAKRGLRVNTVFPSLVYGPPGKSEGANALLRALDRGRFPALIAADRKASWIFLDDLVEGLLSVMALAPAGRDYLMAGEVAAVRDLARRIQELGGAPAPRWTLPLGLARVAVAILDPLLRMAGRRLPVSPDQLRNLRRHWAFDDGRARRELGWNPRPLAEGLPPTLEFLRQQ